MAWGWSNKTLYYIILLDLPVTMVTTIVKFHIIPTIEQRRSPRPASAILGVIMLKGDQTCNKHNWRPWAAKLKRHAARHPTKFIKYGRWNKIYRRLKLVSLSHSSSSPTLCRRSINSLIFNFMCPILPAKSGISTEFLLQGIEINVLYVVIMFWKP